MENLEGAPPQAPSICEEPRGFGRQSFTLHSVYSSSSFAQQGRQGQTFCPCRPLKVVSKRLFLGGGSSETPYLVRSSTFGHAGPQACPPSGDEEEEEDRAGEGCRQETRGVCGLDESMN